MMKFKKLKNSSEYFWTQHAQYKMKQYGLSEQKVRGVLRHPYRKEEGIVKNTIAVMQPVSIKVKNGKKVWNQEVWCMFQKPNKKKLNASLSRPDEYVGVDLSLKARSILSENTKYKIISAWRYPGVSPKNNPIPEDILREIGQLE